MTRWLWVLVAVLVGVTVFGNATWNKRKLQRELADAVTAFDRYVDIGVELRVVVADPQGRNLLDGKPLLRVVRTHRFGGMLDTSAVPPRLCGPSQRPRVWYASEDQEAVILHDDPLVCGQLVHGSEGAGKSRTAGMWLYRLWVEALGEGREFGLTAPTTVRLDFVRQEMFALFAPDWFRYASAAARFVMCDGTRIQLVSTYRQSAAQGSPVQGFNWSGCVRDEGQDQIDVHEDIEARGRSAKHGRYKQLITATAKDDSAWRTLRDSLEASGLWVRRTMLGMSSPFVTAKFWADKKLTMSPREYERRVLALDVGVELAVYYGWDRRRNLVALPQIATDVTAAILANYQSYIRPGASFALVGCHDPGVIYNTTEILRLIMFGDMPTWVVVGEVQTKQTTPGEHAKAVKKYVRERFGFENGPDTSKIAIFCDPHGKGESQTDYQTHYMAFQKEGLDVFSPSRDRIKRTARIGMVNRLLFDAASRIRLVIAVDAQRIPVAPVLVRAFETMEKRAGDDDPEGIQRKDETDQSHGPAALSYGLWPFEQEAFTEATQRTALAEARRVRA